MGSMPGYAVAQTELRRGLANGMIPTPWRGKFWDYRQIGTRLIPHSANISWTVDGTEQIYGEFTITDWRLIPAS